MSDVESSQKDFFDRFASQSLNKRPTQPLQQESLYRELALAETRKGFVWLSDCKHILDYSCGIGDVLFEFDKISSLEEHEVFGVDISAKSIDICRRRHKGSFYAIRNNEIPQLTDASLDGVYLVMILHHADRHKEIFKEVSRLLRPGGKFLVVDLTSTNPIINLGRAAFRILPMAAKNQFSDDLVVDGSIPEKLEVKVKDVKRELEEAGFKIETIEYGHLFLFVFDWIDKLTHLDIGGRLPGLVRAIHYLDKQLCRIWPFQHFAHLFAIRCLFTPRADVAS